METEHWPAYGDPRGRYTVRYPHGWTVTSEGEDRIVIQAPGSLADLVIEYSARECGTAESELRQRRLNYYLVREFTAAIAGRDARIFELRDTMSNIREFRTFFPAHGACCELKWTRPAGSASHDFESAQEAMLSTFDFTTTRS